MVSRAKSKKEERGRRMKCIFFLAVTIWTFLTIVIIWAFDVGWDFAIPYVLGIVVGSLMTLFAWYEDDEKRKENLKTIEEYQKKEGME